MSQIDLLTADLSKVSLRSLEALLRHFESLSNAVDDRSLCPILGAAVAAIWDEIEGRTPRNEEQMMLKTFALYQPQQDEWTEGRSISVIEAASMLDVPIFGDRTAGFSEFVSRNRDVLIVTRAEVREQ